VGRVGEEQPERDERCGPEDRSHRIPPSLADVRPRPWRTRADPRAQGSARSLANGTLAQLLLPPPLMSWGVLSLPALSSVFDAGELLPAG
jgi:hypothetical protein